MLTWKLFLKILVELVAVAVGADQRTRLRVACTVSMAGMGVLERSKIPIYCSQRHRESAALCIVSFEVRSVPASGGHIPAEQ